MLIYIIKRLLLLPFLLLIFSVIAFLLIQAPPGDFLTSYIAELAASGSSMERAQIDALRALYGLDQPMYLQYFKWMGRILTGD
ncbi:MAG: ABC transporter permease, partial [SAR324 cluster bacterium]|nr:ABC transporter permease [SAR324 cluster bacterium]